MSPAFIAIGVTIVVLAIGGAIVALTDGGPMRAGRRALPVPGPWIAIGAILLVVGLVFVPRLFGFTFLFLPMIWSRRARGHRDRRTSEREPDRDPDRNDEDR